MSRHFDVDMLFDASVRAFDVELGPDGDLIIDETPATAMLISLGADARAGVDDELPDGRDVTLNGARPGLVRRRGFSGDAGSPGQKTGSRLWLISRAKQTEITRMAAEDYSREALAWTKGEPDGPATVTASWIRTSVLALTSRLGPTEVTVARPL